MKTLNIAATCAAALALSACTVPESKATAIIEAQGYSNVRLGGISLFGCSEDDTLTRTFKATSANGARVEGVVCAGLLFKGATVRIDSVIAPPKTKVIEAQVVNA